VKYRFFALLCAGLCSFASAEEVPHPTHIMFLNPTPEMRLAVLLKRRNFRWPVMRLGLANTREDLYGMLRFYVTKGVSRAEICREAKDAALIAFTSTPHLQQLDIDAAEMDDTRKAKATPWFVASINRDTFSHTKRELPPERWLTSQSLVTYGTLLQPDPDPVSTVAETLQSLWENGFQHVPIQRIHPKGH
jgi:hypothetical protein